MEAEFTPVVLSRKRFLSGILGAGLFTLGIPVCGQAQSGMPDLASEPKVADAAVGDIRVMATGAIRGPLRGIIRQAEKAIGRPIFIEFGSARGNLKDEILAGQAFEVALLLPDVSDVILRHGKIRPQRYSIAEAPTGVAVRGASVGIDVSSPEKFKAALLGAASVKYAPTGAARENVTKILSELGVRDAIRDRSDVSEPATLAPGEYEIGIYPVSEIIHNKSMTFLGPVPSSLQSAVLIEAVIGAQARDPDAALAFIRFLQGPAIDEGLRENGMRKGS